MLDSVLVDEIGVIFGQKYPCDNSLDKSYEIFVPDIIFYSILNEETKYYENKQFKNILLHKIINNFCVNGRYFYSDCDIYIENNMIKFNFKFIHLQSNVISMHRLELSIYEKPIMTKSSRRS